MVASAGVLTDRGDIAVEQYERLDMHTLQLGVCKWCRNCRSLICTFARFNCLRKRRRAATFLHIISTCTLHFKSFYIITPGNLADGTTSMFVLLIVIGSKGFSDFVNDILSFLHFDSFNWKPSARDCNKFINEQRHRAGSVLFQTLSERSIIYIHSDVPIRHTHVINHY